MRLKKHQARNISSFEKPHNPPDINAHTHHRGHSMSGRDQMASPTLMWNVEASERRQHADLDASPLPTSTRALLCGAAAVGCGSRSMHALSKKIHVRYVHILWPNKPSKQANKQRRHSQAHFFFASEFCRKMWSAVAMYDDRQFWHKQGRRNVWGRGTYAHIDLPHQIFLTFRHPWKRKQS